MTSFDNDENNDRPKTPSEEECCGNACNPCIFDIHKKLLEEWHEHKFNKLKNLKNYLSLTRYIKFIVQDIIKESDDCIFIQLNCASENRDGVIFLSPSQYIIIKLSSISKPYTPISWTQNSIKLLIKLYPDGEASKCIKQLKIGDKLHIRGPYGDFKYYRNSYKNILMLSIGSGIAPLYPLAVSTVEDIQEDTKIKMIAGFKSLSHVPLKNELRLLSDYWNFDCILCLPTKSINIINSHLSQKIIDETLNSYVPETSLILICGTSEFNEIAEKIIEKKHFNNYYIFK